MSQEEILKLIGNISPQAKDYVYNYFKNVEVLCSVLTEHNKGVFIKVDNKDCCIFYASFLNEDNIEDVLDIISNKTDEYISKCISKGNSKEICFNVYGNNAKIINLVRKLGFKSDIEGSYLEYASSELPQLKDNGLTSKGFENDMLKDFIDLFDSAYYQINMDNGWQVNSYSKTGEQFCKKLIALNKFNQVHSFWLNNKLVGAYIFKDSYITDIVVNPIFQNKGYGSYMLAHCIRNIKATKSIDSIKLGVVKTNTGAKRLYERNGFVEISCHAEHSYR